MCSEEQIREAVRAELGPIRQVLTEHKQQIEALKVNQVRSDARWESYAHWTHEDQRRVMQLVENFPKIVVSAVREVVTEMMEDQIKRQINTSIHTSVAAELETIQLRNDAVRYRQIRSAFWKAGLGVAVSNSGLAALIYVIINGVPAS